jgi:predicted metal-dependent phosphoesterase TrpH
MMRICPEAKHLVNNIDLHCHSTVSDGTLPPAEVVALAAQRGVEVLALTDHDDTSGIDAAQQAAHAFGVTLLPGVEISAGWRGQSVHIVGVHIDPSAPVLSQQLANIRAGRRQRAERIAAALEAAGVRGALAGAQRFAQHSNLIGRAHFARYMAEQGYAADAQSVFQRYLVPGKPGYVPHQWAEVADAVNWIRAAGGTAILAHPGRYPFGAAVLQELLQCFKHAGGAALEVVTSAHDAGHVRRFAALAQEYELFASHGSDFHDPAVEPYGPGSVGALPSVCRPLWDSWTAPAH